MVLVEDTTATSLGNFGLGGGTCRGGGGAGTSEEDFRRFSPGDDEEEQDARQDIFLLDEDKNVMSHKNLGGVVNPALGEPSVGGTQINSGLRGPPGGPPAAMIEIEDDEAQIESRHLVSTGEELHTSSGMNMNVNNMSSTKRSLLQSVVGRSLAGADHPHRGEQEENIQLEEDSSPDHGPIKSKNVWVWKLVMLGGVS